MYVYFCLNSKYELFRFFRLTLFSCFEGAAVGIYIIGDEIIPFGFGGCLPGSLSHFFAVFVGDVGKALEILSQSGDYFVIIRVGALYHLYSTAGKPFGTGREYPLAETGK